MRSSTRSRRTAAATAMLLFLTACANAAQPTGAPGGDSIAGQAAVPGADPGPLSEGPPVEAPLPGEQPYGGDPATGQPGPRGPVQTAATPSGGQAGSVPPEAAPAPTGAASSAVRLWSPAEDRTGWTDKEIVICMVAAFTLTKAAADHGEEDSQVFWRWLNDRGGIHGRKVRMITEDTAYSPQGGVQAAESCNRQKPFFVSIVDLDAMPAVREWAERNRVMFLPALPVDRDAAKYRYTWNPAITYRQQNTVLGRYVATNHPGKFAVVWRNSPNWQEGRDAFKGEVTSLGSTVVADIGVRANQGDYTSVIAQLRSSGAQSVLATMNPVELLQLVKQSALQGYRPRWVTAHPINLLMEQAGSDFDGTNGPPAVASLPAPAYRYGDYSTPWAADQRLVEEAFRTYRDGKRPTDFDWILFLAYRQFADMLRQCGPDCTRNKLAGMMLGGLRMQSTPLCPLDFSRGGGRQGGWTANILVGGKGADGASRWKQTATCVERF